MDVIIGALMLFIIGEAVVDKVSPWVNDKVEQYTEKE